MALAIVAGDQWTKLLAVKHLTPAMTAGVPPDRTSGPQSREALEERLEALSLIDELLLFYRLPESPCPERRASSCPSVKVIEGVWNWRYAENPGAAWSLFARWGDGVRVPFLIGVSIAAVFFIVLSVWKLADRERTTIFALSLITGGALGNVIDRVRLGYVIDYIDWYLGNAHWPTFNVADAAISCGVALLLGSVLSDRIQRKHREGPPGPIGRLASSTR